MIKRPDVKMSGERLTLLGLILFLGVVLAIDEGRSKDQRPVDTALMERSYAVCMKEGKTSSQNCRTDAIEMARQPKVVK